MHYLGSILAVSLLLVGSVVGPPAAHADSGCQFVLGFQTLDALIPTVVGNCVDNQAFAANGDALQHTTNGLMAWRKADNFTAFTTGGRTWINGPCGVQDRPNDKLFQWEEKGALGCAVDWNSVNMTGDPTLVGRVNLSPPSIALDGSVTGGGYSLVLQPGWGISPHSGPAALKNAFANQSESAGFFIAVYPGQWSPASPQNDLYGLTSKPIRTLDWFVSRKSFLGQPVWGVAASCGLPEWCFWIVVQGKANWAYLQGGYSPSDARPLDAILVSVWIA